MKTINRRTFLNAAVLSVAVPSILSACSDEKKEVAIHNRSIPDGTTILFQGDSATDGGRNKEEILPNKTGTFGSGYAFLASADLLNRYAGHGLKIYNKGVSGNNVNQLQERWQADCLDIKPGILSIMIGVNDYWHTLNGSSEGTVDSYFKEYDQLLKDTKEKLPDVKLVICEPFVLKTGAVNESWFPEFDSYREKAKDLAKKYNALFVPFQKVFNTALEHAPAEYWTSDGVTPTIAGARLMASAWLHIVTPDEFLD